MLNNKKMLGKKIDRFKKIYKLDFDYISTKVTSFYLFIKNMFMKINNSIFPQKHTNCEKNVVEQNCLFKKDLKLWSYKFFYGCYILCLLMKSTNINKKN